MALFLSCCSAFSPLVFIRIRGPLTRGTACTYVPTWAAVTPGGFSAAVASCLRSLVLCRKEKVIRDELSWWDLFLDQGVREQHITVAWKTFVRFHPQVFEIDNLVALRIIGCGLTGTCSHAVSGTLLPVESSMLVCFG